MHQAAGDGDGVDGDGKQHQQQQVQEEWRHCANWLIRCLSNSPEIQQQAQAILCSPDATVTDLLCALKDGVLLCHTLPALSQQQVTINSLEGFKLATLNSQFVFKQNLQAFLNKCRDHFHLKRSDLFKPEDLIDQENIDTTLQCLSALSNCDVAKESGIEGFHLMKRSQSVSEYYNLMSATAAAPSAPAAAATPAPSCSNNSNHLSLGTYATCSSSGVESAENVYNKIVCRQKPSLNSQTSRAQTYSEMCEQELIDTEKNYVQTLQLLVEKVLEPMKAGQSNWSEVELEAVFKFLPELLSLHRQLLRELQVATELRASSMKSVPQVFIEFKQRLLLYGKYCANLPFATKLLEDAFRSDRRKQDQLQEQMVKAGATYKLTEYLLVPMQRILKYHLLMSSLAKYAKREGNSSESWELARDQLLDVAAFVNETKRDTEVMSLIDDIESKVKNLDLPGDLRLRDYGHMLYDAELRVAEDNNKVTASTRHRHCFLWTRMLMICKAKQGTFSFKSALAIKPTTIVQIIGDQQQQQRPGADTKWTWGIRISSSSTSSSSVSSPTSCSNNSSSVTRLILFARSQADREKWLQHLNKAIDDLAPPGYADSNHHFELATLDSPAICSVCSKLVHGCFFQGYRCNKTGLIAHKNCLGKRSTAAAAAAAPVNNANANNNISSSKRNSTSSINSINNNSNNNNSRQEQRYITRRETLTYVSPLQGDDNGSTEDEAAAAAAAAAAEGDGPHWNEYFVGEMSRDEARDALFAHAAGCFLLRQSRGSVEYAISLRTVDSVKHMRVQRRQVDGKFALGDVRQFDKLTELIHYYANNSLRECFLELDCCLREPLLTASSSGASPTSPTAAAAAAAATTAAADRGIIGYAVAVADYSPPANSGHVSVHAGERVALISKSNANANANANVYIARKLNGQVGQLPVSAVRMASSVAKV